mmetsp:Transcript_14035/g.39998  ORF Transcript_14035/g.39998 Transcript_14035/m.39998 type:complete len:272 (+) Transcript_14035:71-886(+)
MIQRYLMHPSNQQILKQGKATLMMKPLLWKTRPRRKPKDSVGKPGNGSTVWLVERTERRQANPVTALSHKATMQQQLLSKRRMRMARFLSKHRQRPNRLQKSQSHMMSNQSTHPQKNRLRTMLRRIQCNNQMSPMRMEKPKDAEIALATVLAMNLRTRETMHRSTMKLKKRQSLQLKEQKRQLRPRLSWRSLMIQKSRIQETRCKEASSMRATIRIRRRRKRRKKKKDLTVRRSGRNASPRNQNPMRIWTSSLRPLHRTAMQTPRTTTGRA